MELHFPQVKTAISSVPIGNFSVPDIIYTTLCKMQQIYYIHNVVQMQQISYIHNVGR